MEGKREKSVCGVSGRENVTDSETARGAGRGGGGEPGVAASRGLRMTLRGAVGTPGSAVTGLPPPRYTGGPCASQRQGCG